MSQTQTPPPPHPSYLVHDYDTHKTLHVGPIDVALIDLHMTLRFGRDWDDSGSDVIGYAWDGLVQYFGRDVGLADLPELV